MSRPTPMLTAQDVADQLAVTVHEVRQMLASGEIPSHDISRGQGIQKRYRVKQTDLDAWVDGRRIRPWGSVRRRA